MEYRRSTPTVAEDVADRVRRLIHAGALSSGDRLPPERDLAADLGVGRVSVREALRLLAEEGYITVRRGANGGSFVATLDSPYQVWLDQMRARAGELDAILDLRIALEGHGAYLAAQRRSTADLKALGRAISDIEGSSSRAGFRLADAHFHAGVVAAARSTRLQDVVGQARGEFFVPVDTLMFEDQIEVSVNGHAAVLRALEDQDPDRARTAMAEHIEETRTHVHWLLRGERLRRSPRNRPEGRADC